MILQLNYVMPIIISIICFLCCGFFLFRLQVNSFLFAVVLLSSMIQLLFFHLSIVWYKNNYCEIVSSQEFLVNDILWNIGIIILSVINVYLISITVKRKIYGK